MGARYLGAGHRFMTVHSLRTRSLYVAPLRLALGLAAVLAALLSGASGPRAWLAAGSAALFVVFLLFNDPRARFRRRAEPQPLPPDATLATPIEQAWRALFPSTAGVSLLAAIALAFQPVLSAFLGGVAIGLAVAGVASAYFADPALYIDPHSGTLYRA
jgi:hypothetical protein